MAAVLRAIKYRSIDCISIGASCSIPELERSEIHAGESVFAVRVAACSDLKFAFEIRMKTTQLAHLRRFNLLARLAEVVVRRVFQQFTKTNCYLIARHGLTSVQSRESTRLD